jgi:hypothetical protein
MSLLVFQSADPARADALRTVPVSPRYVMAVSITVPTSRAMGTTAPGGTLTAQLGSVRVNGSMVSNWVATVSTGSFRTGSGTPALTIANGQVSYWSGQATATSGSGTNTPGQPTASAAQTLDTTRTAFTRNGSFSSHSVTWNPTLAISVPSTAVAGAYTGTVTHSVA